MVVDWVATSQLQLHFNWRFHPLYWQQKRQLL